MPRAWILEQGGRGKPSLCRCQQCKETFEAGGDHWWHNHFYCSGGCAAEANKCPKCGDNRNWCYCSKDEE